MIAALAIPALGTLAMDPLVSIVDTAWVGRLGTEALAALAIASAVFAALFSIFNFVSMTITPMVAGEVGRNDLRRAGDITRTAVLVSVVVGVIVSIVAIAVAGPIVSGFGATGSVASEASAYLRVRFLALPALLLVMVGHGVFRGHSNTTTPLYVALGMNLVNLVLDPLLMFGLDLGVVGAAWATVIAQLGAAVTFVVLLFVTNARELGTNGPFSRVPSVDVGRIFRAGVPMMIRSASLLAALTASTIAAARIGTADVAAHQIALQIWLFMSFVLDSYAVAAEAMVGTDLGTADVQSARSISHRLLALGFATGCLLSIVLALTAPLVPVFFSASPSVAGDLASIYPFVVILQPLTALVYVWDGIGIGASAFGYLGGAMVIACGLSVATLMVIGGTLVGVWTAILVLSISRLVALAWWQRVGPLARGRGPSPSFRAA